MSDAVVLYLTCPGGKSEHRLIKGRELVIGRSLLGGDPQAAECHCQLSCDPSGNVTVTGFASKQVTAIKSADGTRNVLAANQTRAFKPGETLVCGQSQLTLAPPAPSPRSAQAPTPRSAQAPPAGAEELQRQLQALMQHNQELQVTLDQKEKKLNDSEQAIALLGSQLNGERNERKKLAERAATNADLLDTLQRVNTALRDQQAAAITAAERAELRDLKKSNKKLVEHNEGLVQDLADARAQDKKHTEEIQRIANAIGDAAQAREEAPTLKKELNKLRSEVQAAQDKATKMSKEQEKLKADKDEQAQAHSELKRQLAKTGAELSTAQQELARLAEDREKFQRLYEKIRDRHLEIQQELAEHSEVKRQLMKTRAELSTVQQERARLAEEREKFQRLYEKIRDRHLEIQQELAEHRK